MLLLIRADRHEVGHVQKNVRRHQNRIGEQSAVDVVRVFGGLVLELRHARKLAHVGEAVQNPRQLRVRGNLTLEVNDVLLRIEAAGEENRHRAQTGLAQLRRVLPNRQRVQIHDGIQAVVFVLKQFKIAQRADIIAQRQIARGLNAGENSFFGRDRLVFHVCFLPNAKIGEKIHTSLYTQ